ncbi:MAG: transporter substrate-binding protein [Caulobacteraceae bacterium]|nr:transporter substrate-binding protein [Caulobacteraceae bacterium]
MKVLRLAAVMAVTLLAACSPKQQAASSSGLTPIRFATDWRAQAEHGGFYEAQAEGLYKQHGLDVTIVEGGPSVNVPQLLAAGQVELGMGSNSFIVMNLAKEKAPVKAVAAFMQKDPQVLLAHPDSGINSIADMKGHPILLSDASVTAFWVWLRAKYGFSDSQVRKYTFNSGPFVADKTAVQEGYLTSEPYTIAKEAGLAPKVFLLADEGYPGYASMVLANDSLIAGKPAAIKAFIAASAQGWKDYLWGDPKPADALILKDNPEMTQDVLDQARNKLRTSAIIAAQPDGPIGQMTDQRWQDFFKAASGQGVYPADMDWKSAYTLQFLPLPASGERGG